MSDTSIPAAGREDGEDAETARLRMRARQKADFYRHLVAFVIVGSILAALDVLASPGDLWFQWPMGAWAIGLVLHAADVYLMGETTGLEERIMRREMERRHHIHG